MMVTAIRRMSEKPNSKAFLYQLNLTQCILPRFHLTSRITQAREKTFFAYYNCILKLSINLDHSIS
jgi:hypothetical protein